MELPILRFLPLTEECRHIVERFLRTPHPTAELIAELSIWSFGGVSSLKGHKGKICSRLYVASGSVRTCHHYDMTGLQGIYYKRDNFEWVRSKVSKGLVLNRTLKRNNYISNGPALVFETDPTTGESFADIRPEENTRDKIERGFMNPEEFAATQVSFETESEFDEDAEDEDANEDGDEEDAAAEED